MCRNKDLVNNYQFTYNVIAYEKTNKLEQKS